MAWLWWIGAALVLGVIETLTVDLTFLMFAGGAVGGAIAAALGASFLAQAIVFAVVSTLLLAAVRPWAKWQLLSTTPDMRTNASALIGREATALTVIDERGGRVRLGGAEWSARPGDEAPPAAPPASRAARPVAPAPGPWVRARAGTRAPRPGGPALSAAMRGQAGRAGAGVVELAPGLGGRARLAARARTQ